MFIPLSPSVLICSSKELLECSKRWQHSLNPSLDHSKWSEQDDEKLLRAVKVHGRNWKTISMAVFPTRSGTDIKNRY
jgi:hypothetical protein